MKSIEVSVDTVGYIKLHYFRDPALTCSDSASLHGQALACNCNDQVTLKAFVVALKPTASTRQYY